MKIRMIVANHNPSVRTSFSMLAKVTPGAEYVGIAESVEELLALNAQVNPHIILLEFAMLEEHAQTLLEVSPAVKIICIVNAMEVTLPLEELLTLGTVGCICQDASPVHIREAMIAAFEGKPYQHEDKVMIGVRTPQHQLALSDSEVAILQALAKDRTPIDSLEIRLYLSSIFSKCGTTSLENTLSLALEYGLI